MSVIRRTRVITTLLFSYTVTSELFAVDVATDRIALSTARMHNVSLDKRSEKSDVSSARNGNTM